MKLPDIELPSNQKFGFFFAAIFTAIGVYFFTKNSITASYFFGGLAATFVSITLLNPNFLLPLNKKWMQFGLLVGMIVSPIVMGVIFFGLFTPTSLFMKLIGRDELRLKLVDRGSHWKERNTEKLQNDSFKYQF